MDTDDKWFRAIEDHFVRLRGAPLLLSPGDWHQASEWQRRGIPLDLVLQAISDVFAAAVARGRKTPIQSLRYCRHAVEEAFAQREAGGVGRPGALPAPAPDPVGIVRDLAIRIGALHLPTKLAVERDLLSSLLHGVGEKLEAGALDRAGAEAALAELDRRLIELLQAALPAAEAEVLRSRCDRRLAEFGGRLSAVEADQTRHRMLAAELRRVWEMPRLSVMGGTSGV